MITVVQIETFKLNLPFRMSFGHNIAIRDFSENLIVKVTLSNGMCGYGESIPREYVTGETFDGAEFIVRTLYAPALVGAKVSTVASTLNLLKQKFDLLGLREVANGASWCALELAILDAVSRSLEMSLSHFLGGAKANRIRYGAVVPICSENKSKKILWFYKLFGFETVKIKVGSNLEEDIARVKLARKILGPKVRLRIDANCAWNATEAIEAMKMFHQFDVLSVEQPVPANDLDGMLEVTRSIPEDVIADESLCTVEQAYNLASNHVCTAFNIRLSKNGGLLASQEIAQIARTYGLDVHLGAQVGESGILSAAGRNFACLEGPFSNHEGSNNLFLLKKDSTQEILNVGWGGYGSLSNKPGLGVTINKNMLTPVANYQRSTSREFSKEY